jgi:hypothetical protein
MRYDGRASAQDPTLNPDIPDTAVPAAPPPDGVARETAPETHDVMLDLTFVPTWARQPPGRNPYAGPDEAPDQRRRDRPGRPERWGRPERGERRDRRGREGGERRDRRGMDRDRDRRPPPPAGGGPPPRLPLEVAFLPERHRLGALAHELQASRRAFRLEDVAQIFLSRPEFHLLKLELRPRAGAAAPDRLFQCRACKGVFLNRSALIRHAQHKHLDMFFDVEEIQGEPPSGQFVGVARCTLSGVLLGPPNHHSYNQRVQEMHRERFAHMSLDAYRARIELIRDPEWVEKWKEEARTRRVYREKGGAGEQKPELDRAGAEAMFLQKYVETLAAEGTRFIVPAPVTRQLDDPVLKEVLVAAWNRESRRAYSLLLALRPALRRMRMHFFRANGQNAFVTAIAPQALDPRQAVKPIRKVLQYLGERPGCTRQQLVDGLKPGADPDSAAVAELLAPLRWLIERGHVIEFSDGTLAVPRASLSTGGEPAAAASAGPAGTGSPGR